MQYPKECLGQAQTDMGESLSVGYGSISPPSTLGLADKNPSLLLRLDSLARFEVPTLASGVTSQASAPPFPLPPHYSPLRSFFGVKPGWVP